MLNFLKNLLSGPDLQPYFEKNAIILDVRTKGEYAGGHVKGSKNIPLDQIGANIATIKKWNKAVITCCRSGSRSAMAARQLKKAGIDVVNGGSWNAVQQKLG